MSNLSLPDRIKGWIGAGYTPRQKKISLVISLVFSLVIVLGISYNLLLATESFEYNPLAFIDNQVVDGFFVRRLKSGDSLGLMSNERAMSLAMVDIDDDSLDQMKMRWPIPRSTYARIIQKLQTGGARTIGFDIVMPDASIPEEDAILEQTLSQSGNVFLAEYFFVPKEKDIPDDSPSREGEEEGRVQVERPYEPFSRALEGAAGGANRLGYVSIKAEPVIRRVEMGRSVNGVLHVLLSPLLASHFLDIPQEKIQNHPREGRFQVGSITVPTTQDYARVNYFFPPGEYSQRFSTNFTIGQVVNEFSMKNVLEDMDDKSLREAFGGKMVLVGPTAAGAGDIKNTPFGQIPGVYVHANIILSMLNNRFLSPASPVLNIVLMIIVGILVGLAIPRLSPLAGAIFTALVTYAYYEYCYHSFVRAGAINFVSAPIFCAFMGYMAINVYHHLSETRAKESISRMFKEFAPIPTELIQEYIEKYGGSAATGGELAHVTVMFADIRGYTQMSEGMSSQEVMAVLNEYHAAMGKIFAETGGIVFTYIGDAQLVVYGLSEQSRVNHAASAIKAGVAMQEKMKEIREKLEKRGSYPFEVGVGICTGSLSVGVVGSAQLKQYTVIGDTVNVASRIQGMSRELNAPVLIHERTYLMARHCIEADRLRPVKLKGKKEAVNIFRAKSVGNITPYPGDEIKDLDLEIDELHARQDEAFRQAAEEREERNAQALQESSAAGSGQETGENAEARVPAGVRRKGRRPRTGELESDEEAEKQDSPAGEAPVPPDAPPGA
jgi:adenylate cyclase